MKQIVLWMHGFYKYKNLLKQLVSRDIKLKYRRSVLGYLWSVLNPLFVMLIMVIVFSSIFRSDVENFPLYLISGQIYKRSDSVCTWSKRVIAQNLCAKIHLYDI